MATDRKAYFREHSKKYYAELKADPIRYKTHRAKKAEYDRKRYAEHRDKCLERMRKQYAEHREEINARRHAKRTAQRERRMSMPPKVCAICGKEFPAYEYHPNGGKPRTKYCSEACKNEANRIRCRNRYRSHRDGIKCQSKERGGR